MKNETIETMLRTAPPLRVPRELLSELQSNIDLPGPSRAATARGRITRHAPRTAISAIRRWMPALGFALWILGCVIVLGIQSSTIAQLKEQNVAPRASVAGAAISPDENKTIDGSVAEWLQLRKDATDAQRLRAEAERLREMLAQAPLLRAANEQLREELKAQIEPPPRPEEDMFAGAQGKAATVACVNNLKQVCLAALTWANTRGKQGLENTLPPDFASILGRELASDKTACCPSDSVTRYEILSPNANPKDPDIVYVRCPIHNSVGKTDGSVHQLGKLFHTVQRNGKWVIEKAQ